MWDFLILAINVDIGNYYCYCKCNETKCTTIATAATTTYEHRNYKNSTKKPIKTNRYFVKIF